MAAACIAVGLLLAAPPAAGTPQQPTPAGTAAVAQEVPVTATNAAEQPAHNSPMLAADPTEPTFVALASRLDGPDFGCSLHVSDDAGRGWLPADPVPELPDGVDKCYAPEVGFDADGLLYYLFVGLQEPGNTPAGAYLTTSRDRGRTFSPPVQVLGPRRYMVRMAIDAAAGAQGRIHLVWLEARTHPPLGGLPAPPNPIMAAHSDDGGGTWSTPVQVSDPARARVVAPAVTIGADHTLHVLYYDLRDDRRDYQGLEGPRWEGHWSLVHTRSADGGRTFGPATVVDDELVPPERVMLIFTMAPPALAADASGVVYAAWHDARNGDWDVFLSRSPDAGSSWQAPRRLNDDAPDSGAHQYLPRLALAADGRLDAVFYDRRWDPDNLSNDAVYTASNDRGQTFSPNLRLTSRSSDSLVGPRYAVPSAADMVEFGSRLALWSTSTGALAAWTDTRNALTFEPQDIFATHVSVAEAPGSLGAGGLALAGVAATAVLMLLTAARLARRGRRATPDTIPSLRVPARE